MKETPHEEGTNLCTPEEPNQHESGACSAWSKSKARRERRARAMPRLPLARGRDEMPGPEGAACGGAPRLVRREGDARRSAWAREHLATPASRLLALQAGNSEAKSLRVSSARRRAGQNRLARLVGERRGVRILLNLCSSAEHAPSRFGGFIASARVGRAGTPPSPVSGSGCAPSHPPETDSATVSSNCVEEPSDSASSSDGGAPVVASRFPRGLLPCPPPPCSRAPVQGARTAPVRRRLLVKAAVARCCAMSVHALNFQHTGRPAVAPAEACEGVACTRAQARALRSLRGRVARHVHEISQVHLSPASGRSAASIFDSLVGGVSADYGFSSSVTGKAPAHMPAPTGHPGSRPPRHSSAYDAGETSDRGGDRGPPDLVASRLAIPAVGRTHAPDRYLLEPMRSILRDPRLLEKEVWDLPKPFPRPRFHATRAESVAVLRRMDEGSLIELEHVRELPVGPRGENLRAGAFPVFKSADTDRLVTSRTSANCREHSVGASRHLLPHASSLCEIILPPGSNLRGSGDDLPDFYHSEEVSRVRARSNQLGYVYKWSELADLI